MKSSTQYLPTPKRKSIGYCSFCGAEVEGIDVHFKMNGDYLGVYCLEWWEYEFPDPNNSNKFTSLMKPNYDCNGRPLNLDTVIKTDFNINEFNG